MQSQKNLAPSGAFPWFTFQKFVSIIESKGADIRIFAEFLIPS